MNPSPMLRVLPRPSPALLVLALLVLTLLVLALLAPAAAGQAHWAYTAPVRPALPAVRDAGWSQHPVDRFVRARSDAEGLRHAPPADRVTLLRRVYLDLIGLPPGIAEVDAFLADDSPDAYEKVVDRLLASPRFGEHWARHWLDLARYADSNGFQADQLRESWAFRDWVIAALNRGMPFDRFSIEQLAGDLLPEATVEQRVATGFHRTVTCNVEAGVHPEANRIQQVVDRVNTTATVWLGTTLACAQCHDHKYDPFTQRDYYRLFAFFNNTPVEVRNPLGDKGVRYDFYGPKMALPLPADRQQQRDRLAAEVADLEARHRRMVADAATRQAAWEQRVRAALARAERWQPLPVASFASTGDEEFELLADHSVLVGGRVPDAATYTVRVANAGTGITAVRLEALTHPSLPGTGPGRGDVARPNFVLTGFRVARTGGDQQPPTTVELHGATADYSQANWPVAAAIDDDPQTGWAIGGSFFRDHHATFLTQQPVDVGPDQTLTFTLDQDNGRGRTIGRFRLSVYRGDPIALAVPPAIRKLLTAPGRSPAQARRLAEYYRTAHIDNTDLARQLAAARRRLAAIRPATTLVMVEQDQPRATRVLRRGDYRNPAEVVTAGTPESLHRWRDAWPRNRLGLARWLVARDNPLVARVTVNRWWSQLFGRGIVSTEEDFGTRAAPPTHRALLDWLAVEFMDSGWSMKHVLRLLVTSRTYRQSSKRIDDSDPKNLYLARGPRFRMSAEMIRDNALAVSGLLSTKAGGPPVFPPQPDGLWRQTGRNEPKYVVATDADRFRRGIYVVWRRAAPYPSFVLFDGPDRATCHPTRSRTNTPMQALALMNDEAYVELAMGLALRMLQDGGTTTASQVDHGFRRALARRPQPAEAHHLASVFEREYRRFGRQPAAARELLAGVRGFAIPADVEPARLAGLFFVATILLNLDETISKG